MKPGDVPGNPRVFVSYSWESDGHRHWVRSLAERLVESGVDVILDQWQLGPGENLTLFMERGVRDSDYVLAVCTPTFALKADARAGGVGYEQQIVSGDILQGTPRTKFIPLIRIGDFTGGLRAIPAYLTGVVAIDFREGVKFDVSFDELLRAVFRKKRYVKPNLGVPPALEPEAKAQPVSPVAQALPELYEIEFSSELTPVQGRRGLSIIASEINESIKCNRPFEITVRILPIVQTRAALNLFEGRKDLTLDEREQRAQLKQVLKAHTVFDDCPADLFMAELITTVCRNVSGTYAVRSDDDLTDVLSATISLFSGQWPNGSTKFEMYLKQGSWYASFYIPQEEADALAERVGVPVTFMTDGFGLRLDDFPQHVVRTRAIPSLAFEYFRLKYATKTNVPDVAQFFDLNALRVGLG